MNRKLLTSLHKYLKITHRRIKNLPRKNVIVRFAEKSGMVYFGAVSQHSDEHKIIRGMTVSSTHRDNHYCVGTVNGYDVLLVDRIDSRLMPDGSITSDNWLIFAIELKTKRAVPHIFIMSKNTIQSPYSMLFSAYPNMKTIELDAFEPYDAEFVSRFTVYGLPTMAQEIQRIVNNKVAKVMGAHFWPLSIEQHDNVVYVYSIHEKITSSLLSSMLENGLWLASQIDESASTVD